MLDLSWKICMTDLLWISYRHGGVADPVVDHGLHAHRHAVPGQNLARECVFNLLGGWSTVAKHLIYYYTDKLAILGQCMVLFLS